MSYGNDQDGQLGNGPRVISIGGWTRERNANNVGLKRLLPNGIVVIGIRWRWYLKRSNGLGTGKVHRYVNGQRYDSFTDINGTQLGSGTELLFGAGSDPMAPATSQA